MKTINNLIILCTLAGIGIVSVVFLSNFNKKREEFMSSQRATLDSLLKLESVDITCPYCRKPIHTNMLWIRDSL